MKTKAFVLMFGAVSALTGCPATALNPAAQRIMVTKAAAPAGCTYLGSVVGEQGGSLSGAYTSNAHLAEGAYNDMKNKAHAMGANYVVLEDSHAGNTTSMSTTKGSSSSGGGQTDVTHVGNAFKCPDATPTIGPGTAAPAPVTAPPAAGAPAGTSGPTGQTANHVVIVTF